MIQIEYDRAMKRHTVKVQFTLAGESSQTTVATITEKKPSKIMLHRHLPIKLVHQILLTWEEQEHQLIMKEKREKGE